MAAMSTPTEETDPPILRTARAEDYDRIAGLVDLWWGRRAMPDLPRLFLDHFCTTSLVAEDAQGLAGFLVGFRSASQDAQAYVHFTGVRPDRRRSGLGRLLYTTFIERARAEGCLEVRTVTNVFNTGSIRFHEALGFVASPPRPHYNGPGRPMVELRIRLDR